MKKKIGLLLVIGLMLFSVPVQAEVRGRTYFEVEDNYFRHIIEAGDTFYDLSRKFKVDLKELQSINPELEAENLQVGEEIRISISDELDYYIVQPGDSFWEISLGTGLDLSEIIKANNRENPDYLTVGEVLLLPEGAVLARDGNIKITQFRQEEGAVDVFGLARSFEANISYALETEGGGVLKEGYTTASAAGPYWGSFNIELTAIPAEADYLTVFTVSMKDGSRQDEVKLELN